MRSILSTGILVVSGLVGTAEVVAIADADTPPPPDPRLVKLRNYFDRNDCPLRRYAATFIEVADQNALDWRLLPSISFVESSGGKYFHNNNVFGWDNCRQKFPSIEQSIHIVGSKLANSDVYRGKDLEALLRTYNPARSEYPRVVRQVMQEIARADSPRR